MQAGLCVQRQVRLFPGKRARARSRPVRSVRSPHARSARSVQNPLGLVQPCMAWVVSARHPPLPLPSLTVRLLSS